MDTIGTRAEIHLDAAAHNIRELKRITAPHADLMAVVKADAYGHGAVEIAQTALDNGAKYLGVARLGEGIRLRESGISSPILIFGYTPPNLTDKLLFYDLTQTVGDSETARRYADIAGRQRATLRIHLKIDTGMGRLGFACPSPSSLNHEQRLSQITTEIFSVLQLPHLDPEGMYTHFACADHKDKTHAQQQFSAFCDLLEELYQSASFRAPIRHAANSAAIIDMPETHLDMVRAGISLYGLLPSRDVDRKKIALRPVMELKSNIIHLKTVAQGFSVSYGGTWKAPKDTTIATIPIGYADGYNRLLSYAGYMMVHGKKAPIAGRVCMDLVMLDVGDIPDTAVNDEVIVFGGQTSDGVTVDEIAETLGTINYEVVSTVSSRVPRVFL